MRSLHFEDESVVSRDANEILRRPTFRILLTLLLLACLSAGARSQCPEKCYPYQVDEPETLREISIHFGSVIFSDLLFELNPHLESSADPIDSGTLLFIPPAVWNFRNTNLTPEQVIEDPWRKDVESTIAGETVAKDTLSDLTHQERLRLFRETFGAIVDEEKDSVDEKQMRRVERKLFMELDGMVIDDTRSKIGRDFYDVFYQRWTPPEDAYNYTVRITEKPVPSLGSMITVHVNDIQTFRYRLPPRYDLIEQAAVFAVAVTRRYLIEFQPTYEIY